MRRPSNTFQRDTRCAMGCLNRSSRRHYLTLAILAGAVACGRGSTSAPGPASADSTPTPAAAATTQQLAPGNRVPDAVLAGARHWDRGGAAGNRILVVNFNLDENRLRAVHDDVRNTPALKGAAGLLTLTADPNAMPAVLRSHADRLQADAEVWRFASLPPSAADTVLGEFGAAHDNGVVAI